jgi:hypothetical protein
VPESREPEPTELQHLALEECSKEWSERAPEHLAPEEPSLVEWSELEPEAPEHHSQEREEESEHQQ